MVNGWCMGGGHELALWCDLVIASENAVLGQTGAKVGACPTVGRDAIPAAHHRRAARARDDLLRPALHREGGGGDRPHQQMRAAEGPAARRRSKWCETIKGHSAQTLRMTKKLAQLRIRQALFVVAARHGAARARLGLGGSEEGMNAFLAGPQARLPEIPHAQQARARGLSRRLRPRSQRAAVDAQEISREALHE